MFRHISPLLLCFPVQLPARDLSRVHPAGACVRFRAAACARDSPGRQPLPAATLCPASLLPPSARSHVYTVRGVGNR